MEKFKKIFKKTGITISGFALLIAGAAMLVLPGPGIVVIILGLAVLSAEYEWAKGHMEKIKKVRDKTASRIKASKGK